MQITGVASMIRSLVPCNTPNPTLLLICSLVSRHRTQELQIQSVDIQKENPVQMLEHSIEFIKSMVKDPSYVNMLWYKDYKKSSCFVNHKRYVLNCFLASSKLHMARKKLRWGKWSPDRDREVPEFLKRCTEFTWVLWLLLQLSFFRRTLDS